MAINFVTFNQDYSRLAVGTTRGFRIYTTDPEFRPAFQNEEDNVSIVEMMFSTSLVALVTSPRRLIIRNTKRSSTICEFTYPSAILAVRLNRKRLVVVLEEEMFIYDILHMNLLYTIATSPNPNAICALSADSENCYLAYPLPKAQEDAASRPSHVPPSSKFIPPTSGELLIFDAQSLKNVNVIEAHKSPLSFVALNTKGTLLATASETGTIIRVFSVPGGQKLYQFRRGTYPSTIYSMSFNLSSTLLTVSSATDTIHIFRLGVSNTGNSRPGSPNSPNIRSQRATSYDSQSPYEGSPPPDQEYSRPRIPTRKSNGTLGSMFRRTSQMMGKNVAGVVGGYLPQAMTEMWEPARDFAYIKIPKTTQSEKAPLGVGMRTVVAMSGGYPWVFVVTNDGSFYVFSIDMETGGEGVLIKQFSVLDDKSEGAGVDE